MVVVWWSAAGLIHHSFLDSGETITAERYCQDIDEMHRKLQLMSPGLVKRKGPILFHDNARPYVAQTTLNKLNELGYETVPHPAYSSDLAPTTTTKFSSISTTSSVRNASTIDTMSNRPSSNSSLLSLKSSMQPG
ncbi:hypothetical protein V3C99_018274 [Haemonchus contortus]|uniref:Histone-lysine N-methyltransferase SETMAR n=1 Tax=Haemonchus contortus TaxID=6289 RepID=A0A7I4Z0K3_HAECO